MTALTNIEGRTEQMAYDMASRCISYTSPGGSKVSYDYDKLNRLVEKAYEDSAGLYATDAGEEGVLYGYDALGQRTSMFDRSGTSSYEYDSLGRITKVTSGSGEVVAYKYDDSNQLQSIGYSDGTSVSYRYDKNDNLTHVTDRSGEVTEYQFDEINRITQIIRPNGIVTRNIYNGRDQIIAMENICEECGWVVSRYEYAYDDRGYIIAENSTESLYGYVYDDKHGGKHDDKHDSMYPHGSRHNGKHDKDGDFHFQVIDVSRTFEYDASGRLVKAVENEQNHGETVYTYQYSNSGNRTYYGKSKNGKLAEYAEYTYNDSNQMTEARVYDGKKTTKLSYRYDANGNLVSENGKIGTDQVEKTYCYTVENRLKAVYDGKELLMAAAYDGDGNRIFQLNYNLHSDDDWKGSSGNRNGNNKDNTGSGNNGNGNSNNTWTSQNNNGKMDTAYIYGNGRLGADRFTGDEYFYLYDPRGSVAAITDADGGLGASYQYDPFGSITFGGTQYNNIYAYNAESYNPNVDAQYLRARYYNPTTGNFISEDSKLGDLLEPLSLNRYSYTYNSPLNYTDPSGRTALGTGAYYFVAQVEDHNWHRNESKRGFDFIFTKPRNCTRKYGRSTSC